MNVVFLSLGGNIGDRLDSLEKTRKLLEAQCGQIVKSSSVYETAAWGSTSKNKYLNQVVQLHTHLRPLQLLKKTLHIEKELGRVRGNAKNDDRTADIDILFYNDEIISNKNLQVPHPRLQFRKFVLVPLNEIDRGFVHPVLRESVGNLLKHCDDNLTVNVF